MECTYQHNTQGADRKIAEAHGGADSAARSTRRQATTPTTYPATGRPCCRRLTARTARVRDAKASLPGVDRCPSGATVHVRGVGCRYLREGLDPAFGEDVGAMRLRGVSAVALLLALCLL